MNRSSGSFHFNKSPSLFNPTLQCETFFAFRIHFLNFFFLECIQLMFFIRCLSFRRRGRPTKWRRACDECTSSHRTQKAVPWALIRCLSFPILWYVDHEINRRGPKRFFMSRADRKSQVRQCLVNCTADFWSSMASESAAQKPKYCLT